MNFYVKNEAKKGVGKMRKNKLVAPVLKWVGGKRQLLDTFRPLLQKKLQHTVSHLLVAVHCCFIPPTHFRTGATSSKMGRWEETIIGYFPPTVTKKITTYCEPFVGGGALLFHLQPNTAYINDINPELIRVYTVIKENVDELIEELEKFENTAKQVLCS